MLSWPAVSWIAPDGTTGTRLFASPEEAHRWGGDQWAQHPNWEWLSDDLTCIPHPTVFTVDGAAVGVFEMLLRKTILRFFAEQSDTFMVRDWGLASVDVLRRFGCVQGPDEYGLVTVIGKTTPALISELVKENWFELFLWHDEEWLFGLDDRSDVAFMLTQQRLLELERIGVAHWMLSPESLGGHGYSFSHTPRPVVTTD